MSANLINLAFLSLDSFRYRNGQWSVSTENVVPYKYLWNFWTARANTKAKHSFSITANALSLGFNFRLAYATGFFLLLSSCRSTAFRSCSKAFSCGFSHFTWLFFSPFFVSSVRGAAKFLIKYDEIYPNLLGLWAFSISNSSYLIQTWLYCIFTNHVTQTFNIWKANETLTWFHNHGCFP